MSRGSLVGDRDAGGVADDLAGLQLQQEPTQPNGAEHHHRLTECRRSRICRGAGRPRNCQFPGSRAVDVDDPCVVKPEGRQRKIIAAIVLAIVSAGDPARDERAGNRGSGRVRAKGARPGGPAPARQTRPAGSSGCRRDKPGGGRCRVPRPRRRAAAPRPSERGRTGAR